MLEPELAGQMVFEDVCDFEHIVGDPVFTERCRHPAARLPRQRRTSAGMQVELPLQEVL